MSNVDFCFQPEQGINFIATQFNKNLEIKKEWLKSVYSHLPQLEKNLIQEIVCKKRHIPENAREEWAQDHLFDDILLFKSVIREIWQSKVDAIIEKILVK